ncbi:MAG: hypothetical protein EPN14_00505 [Gallionella sp.]|nr:MAG: hypothetical protein EPN14_00505 [Gallionella sp.]
MPLNNRPFDIHAALNDMDGGVLMEKLAATMTDTALSVVNHGNKGKTGEVTLKLTLERIGDSRQVLVKHKISYKKLTARGDAVENDTTETPFYVNGSGHIDIMPQTADIFSYQQPAEKA